MDPALFLCVHFGESRLVLFGGSWERCETATDDHERHHDGEQRPPSDGVEPPRNEPVQ